MVYAGNRGCGDASQEREVALLPHYGIYIQEVTSLQFLPLQSAWTKKSIYIAMQCFTQAVDEAAFLTSIQVQPEHWYLFFATGTRA